MNLSPARRLQRIRPSATVSITTKAIELAAQGRDIISLSVGEPDFDTPQHIKAAAVAAIEAGLTKYTALDGTRALKQAIQAKFREENGLEFALDQILVSSGAKQACFNLCQSLLDEGDEVIIPAPYWVSYPGMVGLANAEPVIVHSSRDSGFRISSDQLAGAITAATRLLILNSPCNPTGAVYGRDEWEALGRVLADHPRIVVLADDIYEHFCWSDQPFVSFAQACPALSDRTVTVNGMSKGYAMSGWRVGYAAGPAEIIGFMKTVQSQSTTNACSISQAAAEAALVGDQVCVRRMCKDYRERHDVIQPLVDGIEGFECPRGQGAFYLFPDISAALKTLGMSDDVEFCEALLDAKGVALVPGTAFGTPDHLRISYAAPLDVLKDAIDRLVAFMEHTSIG